MADQAKGGQGNYYTPRCFAAGMPHMMIAFRPPEFIIAPDTTYILTGGDDHSSNLHRRTRLAQRERATFSGYSIGRWIDEAGGGRYDVLEVETRGPFKGPRAYDATGLLLHHDNQSIFKERMYRDKADLDIFHDEITVIDHALTRPWAVDKKYVGNPKPRPDWPEYYCGENNAQVFVGKETIS
jgi:hypothetical protein